MKKKIVILAAVAMLCACASHRDSSKTKWKETPYASVKQDGKGKKEKKSKKKKKDKAFSLGAKLSKGNGKLTYKSSNTKIAKVSSKGKVTLTGKAGTVKITVTAASSNNYNKAAKTVTIKVK